MNSWISLTYLVSLGWGLASACLLGWPAVAAEWISPVAVPLSAGPAFPQGRANGNPPDPQYAAERAMDGDRDTFCCLLDDSLTGTSEATIPVHAAAPVTGYMVFDLGQPRLIVGARLTSRDSPGAVNPKRVDFFYFADDVPTVDKLRQAPGGERGLRPLCEGRSLPPLRSGAAETVTWDGVVARYVGLRVHDSYESGGGGVHYNFQIAEIQFYVAANAGGLAPGSRLPSPYVKQDGLVATLLATRARLQALGLVPPRPGETRDASSTEPRHDSAVVLPAPVVGPPSVPGTNADGDEAAAALVERVWQAVRQDFPPAENPLLQYVPHPWFATTGWLAQSTSTDLEQQLVRRAIAAIRLAGTGDLAQRIAAACPPDAPPSDPRWLQSCTQAAEFAQRLAPVDSLRRAITDLAETFPGRYRGAEYLVRLQDYVRSVGDQPPSATLRAELARLQYDALVAGNPLLSPGRLLFVKRYTYSPGWYYADFMRASRFGGGLCILSLPDGQVTEISTGLQGGIFDRFDLSFDAARIAFGYKAAAGQGFRLYEVGIDGHGLRPLTVAPDDEAQRIEKYWHPAYKPSGVYRHHTDDFHPCYLPDGGWCFASTRCERGVICDQSDSLAVNTLHRIDGAGQHLQSLSENALSESTPSVLPDGRVLYTRWEYVDKGVIAVQGLWAMRPDGTGTREVYGNDLEYPPVLIHARAVPGSNNLLVATATMHHPFAVGPIVLVRSDRDVRTLEAIQSLTPDTDLSVQGKDGRPHAEDFVHRHNDRWVKDNRGPLFADPYPLADPQTGVGAGKYFLVTCNPDRPWSDPAAYGLYLIDIFGNRVPIYHDPAISCWQPIPLQARPRPPLVAVAAAAATPVAPETPTAEATVVLSDVYAGLDGVPRGTVKYLRVLEQVARPWAARRFWPDDSAFGQHAPISLCAHIHVKVHHGVVPVESDGSAHFVVPAGANLFFQALDENFMEVQRMRTFVNFQPGESRTCTGCHEFRPHAPVNRVPLALQSPARRLEPQPGETVPRPIDYAHDVQPLWDRHCVTCHNQQRRDGSLDLSGELTTFFSRSYEQLFQQQQLAYIQEFYGPQPDAQVTNAAPVPPRTIGSVASPLVQLLRRGHYDVRLSAAEWARLVTWVDANGPYYGSYFGRRNLKYRDLPDFRPVPTLDSARGVAASSGAAQ